MSTAIIIKMVLGWIRSHWRELAGLVFIGVIIVGASMFYSSWQMRGAKVDRLQIELDSSRLARASERQACQEIADILTEVNAHNVQLRVKSNAQKAAFVKADTIAAKEIEYNRSEAETATADAVEAIERAATCEEKVAELARVMSEWRP